MIKDRAREASLDLAWSLWTELGVPGPRRNHQRAILDPERLILVTPWSCRDDARIIDLAFAWCTQHSHRISAPRLAGLLRTTQLEIRASAERFLGELAAHGVKIANVQAWPPPRPRDSRDLTVRLERAALLRLRVRTLVGVSGRADVITALLASPKSWVTAAELEDVGIAKRNVAVILGDFAEGGIALSRRRGNAREFRLSNPTSLGAVVALPQTAVFADWSAIFEWMRLAVELSSIPADKPATLQVEVARHKATVESLALALGLPLVPSGSATQTVAWLVDTARAIADGVAPAVGGTGGVQPKKRPASAAQR
jgi:hypothetical protein